MCQLLGMNCNVPTDICFSFSGFQARGGATDVHSDGWGIAFFEGKGTRLFLDPQPSATSPVAELVRHYPIRSRNVIAHIRKATQGSEQAVLAVFVLGVVIEHDEIGQGDGEEVRLDPLAHGLLGPAYARSPR